MAITYYCDRPNVNSIILGSVICKYVKKAQVLVSMQQKLTDLISISSDLEVG